MLWQRRMEKISCTYCVRNKELCCLRTRRELKPHKKKNTKYPIVNWSGYILRRKCLLKYVIEGKINGREDEKEDISSFYVTWRNKDDVKTWKRKHRIAMCGTEWANVCTFGVLWFIHLVIDYTVNFSTIRLLYICFNFVHSSSVVRWVGKIARSDY